MPKKSGRKKSTRKRKRKGFRHSPFFISAVIVAAFIFGALSILFIDRYTGLEVFGGKGKDQIASIKKPLQTIPKPAKVIPPPPLKKKPEIRARVAIVIDDFGQNRNPIKSGFFKIDEPINIAVLPHLRYSAEVARLAHGRGWDVLLHTPMEPKNSKVHNPGEGVLLTTMSKAEVRSTLNDGLSSVPHASGINNHMGSKFTEDKRMMAIVIDIIKKKGLFFLDSRTSAKSVARDVARSKGVPSATRSVFLDNERSEKYIEGQVDQLLSTALKRGSAIAIGHPYPETIAVLKRRLPALEDKGIKVVKLSELLE